MTLYSPLWLQATTSGTPVQYSAAVDRSLLDTLFTTAGIVGPGDLAVTAGSGMAVTVAAGRCVVSSELAGGKYLCWSDAAVNVPLAAAPGAGLSRVDLVVAKVYDALVDGSGQDSWTPQAVTGTASSSSPTAPAVPAGSIVLATVAVGANATTPGTITDQRALAGVLGTVRGNPAGRAFCGTINAVSSGTMSPVAQTGAGASKLMGGMVLLGPGSNSACALVAPVSGLYQCNAQLQGQSGKLGDTLIAGIGNTGGVYATVVGSQPYASAAGQYLASQASDVIYLPAGSQVYLAGVAQGCTFPIGGGQQNYISAALVSQGMTNVWQFVVATTAGELVGVLDTATSRTCTWVLTDVSTASFDLSGTGPLAGLIDELETDLLIYCNGTLWFRGRLGASTDTIDTTGHACTFTAVSYRALSRRILWPDPSHTDGQQTFTGVEQTAIAWQLIAASQALPGGDIGITDGSDATGITRDATYSEGALLTDLINQLAALDDGFDWDILPDLTFAAWYPQRGVPTGALAFPGNVVSVARAVDTSTFANAVWVTDSNTVPDGEGGTTTLTAATAEADDFGPAGRFELSTSSTTITDQATLDAFATTTLADSEEISPSYTMVLQEGWWDPTQLWLGDEPQLLVVSGRLDVNTTARVTQIEVDVGDDGGETVTITCGDVIPDQTLILRDVLRRLARLETR